MARTADHDERRRQIAAAVRALLAGEGFGAATMSRVAREAGFSVGLVQHYFPSKDDLLRFTYGEVMAAIGGRVAARIASGVDKRQPIATVVRHGLIELLPLDAPRRDEFRVTRSLLGRSLENPDLAAIAAATSASLRQQIATAVTNGKECGEVEVDVEADLAAVRIFALVDGLAGQLYLEPDLTLGRRTFSQIADDAVALVVAEVFTGECRQYA